MILITVGLMTTLDVVRQRNLFNRQIEERGLLLSRTLNDVFGNALYFRDMEKLRHLVDAVRANPEIQQLRVFAADGRILVGPRGHKYPVGRVDDEVLRIALAGDEAPVRMTDGRPEVINGIRIGGQTLGGLHFVFATESLDVQVAATVRQHLYQAALVVALGVGLALYLARSLVRPVRSLTAATRRIAAGDLDATVETQRRDEIGELAIAMQDMSEHLRRTERERAQRQTSELRLANRTLEAEVAERERIQAQRELLIAELEARNTEMERFNYTVSHDLRSPLVTIRGFLQEVKKALPGDTDPRVHDDIQRIYLATERMRGLLDDLLEVSRVGRLSRPREAVDLSEAAAEALELMTGPLAERGVDAAVESDLPVVFAERDRFLEVFQNLIENAAKFAGEEDRPLIRIGAEERDGEAVCYVRDNGIGIDPKHQEKVFGIFTQLSPKYPGSGIGLALVKRIIETHDGRIWVESEGAGTGSKFCFTLPDPAPSGADEPPPEGSDQPSGRLA